MKDGQTTDRQHAAGLELKTHLQHCLTHTVTSKVQSLFNKRRLHLFFPPSLYLPKKTNDRNIFFRASPCPAHCGAATALCLVPLDRGWLASKRWLNGGQVKIFGSPVCSDSLSLRTALSAGPHDLKQPTPARKRFGRVRCRHGRSSPFDAISRLPGAALDV